MPERLADARLLALAARVGYALDPSSPFPRGFPGWVRVHLRDGRMVEAREPDGRGGPARPIEPRALIDKFRENATRAVAPPRVDAIERAALALDRLDDVGALMGLCRL